MRYGLTRLVLASDSFVEITKDEFEQISSVIDRLLAYTSLEEKFDLIAENYIEFETALLQSATQMMLQGGQTHGWFHAQRRLFNRRLTNLLSASKTYIDCAPQHFSNMLPDDAGAMKRIEDQFKQLRDQRFEYRAMAAIRNHAQHSDDPIHGVTFPSKWDKPRTTLQFSVTPQVHPAQFRFDNRFTKGVLVELEAMGEQVDLKPLVRGFIETLSIVHDGIRDETKALVAEWKALITGSIKRFEEAYPGESIIGLVAMEALDEGGYDRSVNLLNDFLEYSDYLRKKNALGNNFLARHVTGEIVT